ncbi:cytochrome P450 [Flammula alnicola]|nr:cytochrome P450 [Flammula alnicola]
MEKEGAYLVERPENMAAWDVHGVNPSRALHSHLQLKIVTTYAPTSMKNARQHIFDIIEMPDRHQDHAKRCSASVVMALAYGKNPKSYEDPDMQAVNRCLTRLGNTLRPGVWKVGAYPILRYVPGYPKELKDGHAEELELFKSQLNEVRMKAERGEEIPDSFGKYLLEKQKELELTDGETAYLAGSMFSAGSDTTASVISIGVLAAACNPDAQAKVQQELGSIIGRERAPTLADPDVLPQTMAFVLETFRWRPVSAGGFAHKVSKDIIRGNYPIPKGREPEYFPDPEKFNPQRWIDEKGKIKEDLKAYTFGFGRR